MLNRFKMALPAALLLLPALCFAGWVTQNSGTTNHLLHVDFPVDAQTGFVVGYSGLILKTTDGGATGLPRPQARRPTFGESISPWMP
jgi:photosystem II stability/assembly factor-like uncharacterized protein